MQRDVFFPFEAGVGGFTRHYLGLKPEVTKNFIVDDAVLLEFRRYLDKQGIGYTEPEIAENLVWIKRKIKREVLTSVFGLSEGYKVELEDDVQVQKAVDSIPQARALYENARKIIAQRTGAQNTFR
jgi:carboxyl-terminal processing protease